MNLDALIAFYHAFSEDSVEELDQFYAQDAWFKDPFNEVQGLGAIKKVFGHMFHQVHSPRFVVTDSIANDSGALVTWEFRFRFQGWNSSEEQRILGASHLKFNSSGKIVFHRDYWDASEELYMKLPVVGALMRWLQKKMSATRQ